MEVLSELELGDFKVRLNHRLLLNGILRVCGVPKNRLEVVHVALARLGREDDWAAVRSILCENHGLEAEVTPPFCGTQENCKCSTQDSQP